MSRTIGTLTYSDGPVSFRARVRQVVDRNRLRLPNDLVEVVRWLKEADVNKLSCVATIGPLGGLLLMPTVGGHADARVRLMTELANNPPTFDDVASQFLSLARYFALAWEVPVASDSGHLVLTLPEEPRKLEIVPREPELAIIFGSGDILEICKAQDVVAHLRELSRHLRQAVVRAFDELESRNQEKSG